LVKKSVWITRWFDSPAFSNAARPKTGLTKSGKTCQPPEADVLLKRFAFDTPYQCRKILLEMTDVRQFDPKN